MSRQAFSRMLGVLAIGLLGLATACSVERAATPAPAPATASGGASGASADAAAAASAVPAAARGEAAAAPAPPAREAVRIPYSALSLSMLPHWLTYDAGLYEREGLDVTMDYVATSTTLGPALLNGEIPMADAGQEIAVASSVQGGDMVVVTAGLDRAMFWLAAAPGLRVPADLQGKRVGITRFGSISDTVLRFYLGTVGLQPAADVTILQMGGYPEAVAGLQSGALDAALLSPPSVFAAQRNGAVLLADMGDLDFPIYQSAIVTTRRYLADRADVMRRVARAHAQGWRLLGDEPQALASLKRYSGESDDELVAATYHAGIQRFPDSPVPRVEPIRAGLQQLAAQEPAALQLSPEQILAPEYMAEAVAALGR
ncbi:MAG TPA: ABC transporter substrate-binding protein [Chloroflexota bacterium]|jgi:ABC-type nitrate/sulfonate/bicarbonate transport system substrate-binding protein